MVRFPWWAVVRLIGVSRAAVIAQKVLPYTIPSDMANVDLHAFAVSQGYIAGDVRITNPAGREIYSNSYATPALVYGTGWPTGTKVEFVNKGKVTGAGGIGGHGAIPAAATNGTPGGTAIDASMVSGYTASLDNTGGTAQGGGGGGGGGNDFSDVESDNGGGGGGGGAGRVPGTGGIAGPNGQNGTDGTTSTHGNGGNGGTGASGGTGATGGNGGNMGAAGTAGGVGGGSNPPGAGGAAGKSINGIGNLTVIASGTLTGPTA